LVGPSRKESVVYARIARFEGGDPARIDAQADEMRGKIRAGRESGLPEDAPQELRTLSETVTRFVELADRGSGASVGIAFCESEEDMRRADEALNAMSPPAEDGSRRTTVEIYEVVLDESLR
jgi:hypothetical protein